MTTREQPSFAIVTLGCPKNVVDSQHMEEQLEQAGYARTEDVNSADVLVVNTCCFIDAAKEESVNTLQGLNLQRKPGQRIIAAGCMAQIYAEELQQAVPEVDAILGTRNLNQIDNVVASLGIHGRFGHLKSVLPMSAPAPKPAPRPRISSAYLKIADGCSAPCTFCIIPTIKGGYQSRSIEQVVAEARRLADRGAQELVLVAQDTTAYGYDWGKRDVLAALLEELVKSVPDVPWLRLMYVYPSHITPRLLKVMASHPQIVPYIDIPLQHANLNVLRRMKRPARDYRALIRNLRENIPNLALRSSFIAGFPGETDEEFADLLDFLEEVELDRVGVFTYSQEPGTPAGEMGDQIAPEIKQKRRDKAMRLQQRISLAKNRSFVGETLDVLIEGVSELPKEEQQPRRGVKAHRTARQDRKKGRKAWMNMPGLDGDQEVRHAQPVIPTQKFQLVGRSYRDAPEVDGLILIQGEVAPEDASAIMQKIGKIVPVRITGALEYDLIGELA